LAQALGSSLQKPDLVRTAGTDMETALRVLVINPSGEEVLGIVGDVLREYEAEVDEVVTEEAVDMLVSGQPSANARVVPSLPQDPGSHDFLVILGSHLGVLTEEPPSEDDMQTPPTLIEQIEELVRGFHQAEKPVLGICGGSQLVARSFGARVSKMPKDLVHTALPLPAEKQEERAGCEFGWHKQNFLPAAEKDPVVGPALQAMRAKLADSPNTSEQKFMLWHRDTFQIPEGAVQLSSRQTCAAQAFRLGQRTYAFQYHIEVDDKLGLQWAHMFSVGADSFEDKENWKPVDTETESAVKEHVENCISEGSVSAAEEFTRTTVHGLLREAAAARQEADGPSKRGRI